MPSKPKTIKELKEQRRKENFVGRTEQQQVFTENFAGEEPKWVVLSVTGEGGVGKSTLLKRYTQLAQGDEVNAPDRARFVEVAETEAMSLHEGNISRYRLRPSEYDAWRAVWT